MSGDLEDLGFLPARERRDINKRHDFNLSVIDMVNLGIKSS